MKQKLKEWILYRKEQIIMSEKRLDAKNRWRNVVVAFRMSPEEAQELNVKVSLSGLSKQDYRDGKFFIGELQFWGAFTHALSPPGQYGTPRKSNTAPQPSLWIQNSYCFGCVSAMR